MTTSGNLAVRLLLASLVALLIGFVALLRFAHQAPSFASEAGLDEVYRFAERGELRTVKLLDEDALIIGLRCLPPIVPTVAPVRPFEAGGDPTIQPATPTPVSAPADPNAPAQAENASTEPVERRGPCDGPEVAFSTPYPRSDVATQRLIDTVKDGGAAVVVEKQTSVAVAKLLTTFVFPLLMLAALFGLIFLSRGSESSMADIAGFGTLRRKRHRKRHIGTGVSFADVAGAEEAVAELREVTDYLKDPLRFEAFGAAPPKGVLLFGPPGCGKTLLARAVAGESNVPFFSISGAEFVESLVGVGAARVRDLFRQVREEAPAIVFIDEIDAVGRRRSGEGLTGGEREQTVNQLLVELDGFEVTSGIVLMGATNRPDILDPALLRPGRFDRHVTLEPPDVHGRRAILELHARAKPISPEVDFDHLARRTPGFTGADLANVINEAALLTLRQGGHSQIQMTHLAEAVQRVVHGPQRRGRLMAPDERRRLAFHEAGHAVVAASLGHAGDVQRVSIVARGRSLAQSTNMADDPERVLATLGQMQRRLAVAMGGIAAEVLVFGESSTTAQDDIDKATAQARGMVGLYGMSPQLGRVRLLSKDDTYLGHGETTIEVVSAQTIGAFDEEVKNLIAAAERTAAKVLAANRARLDQIAEALQEEETLEGPTLADLLSEVRPAPGPRTGEKAPA